jgi:KDO2-lipid IV(A) lauroyltransferase
MGALPLPVAVGLARAAAAVLARRDSGPRRLAEHHLRRVLTAEGAGIPPDPALVRRWARRAFSEYAYYWAEGAQLPGLRPAKVLDRMLIEQGWGHLEAAQAAGQGIILAIPHIGAWEWGGSFLSSAGYAMTAVAERIEPPELFDWFIEQRRAMGLSIVPLGPDSGSEILRALRAGGLVGLLCDRDLQGNGVGVDFFGGRTTLPAGPVTLALRTGAAVIPTIVYRGPGRNHNGVLHPPLDLTRQGSLRQDVTRLTQELAGVFEGAIRRAPEQWHLFQPNWPDDPGVGD